MAIDRRARSRAARIRGEKARAERYESSAFDRNSPRPIWMYDRTRLPKRPPQGRA